MDNEELFSAPENPSEALGIAFCKIYGKSEGRIIEINITQRSMIGSTDALTGLIGTLKYAKEHLNMHPYPPSNQPSYEEPPQPVEAHESVPKPAPVQPIPTVPAPEMPDQDEYDVFQAEELEGSMSKGKTYWKVKGGRWKAYGVTVWDEVLQQAGLIGLDPTVVYDIKGFEAKALLVDGKPKKVVELKKT